MKRFCSLTVRVCVLLLLFFLFCRRKSQQAEREYEKVKHQLDSLEESVRDRCKKEFTGVQSQNFGGYPQPDLDLFILFPNG